MPYTKSLWSVRGLEKPEVKGEDIVLSVDNVDAAYGISRCCTMSRITAARTHRSGRRGIRLRQIHHRSGDHRAFATAQRQRDLQWRTPSRSLKDRSKDQLQRIQMIYQMADTAMNPRQTVEDIIGRPLEFYLGLKGKEREERVLELLDMIELDESFMDRLPSELSGGQKQRICIARALAARPDIIICDEVTSALDQIVQEGILQLLLRLQKKYNITYLFITHDIATVKAISDEIVVMFQGKVVEQGLKSEILAPPFPDYTKLLLSSVPEMDPDWLTNLLDARGD
jgi:peptide/nickel transport system ATP-binding protein